MDTIPDTSSSEELTEPPEFELEYLYDDRSSPSTLTIFAPENPRLTTEWLTVDRSIAVSLDQIQ